jgi:hypothetical protein
VDEPLNASVDAAPKEQLFTERGEHDSERENGQERVDARCAPEFTRLSLNGLYAARGEFMKKRVES